MRPAVRVPFIDLQPVTALVRDRALPRWQETLQRCELVGGPSVAELARALTAQLQIAHAVPCASGTDALILSLQAAGVGPGDHVALPNLTFWATFEAVAQLGAVPVLVDIDPDDLQLSLDGLRRAFERFRFRHAILVHLFGWASARTAELRAFCRERDVVLVEDGAQCFGVTLEGRSIFADAGLATLSFYPAKVIGGCMDGGAVLAADAAMAERVRRLANHGRASHYAFDAVGWSSRMGGLNAGYLVEMLGHAAAIVEDRRAAAARYRQAASSWRGVRHRVGPAGVGDNGYLCVVECERRGPDELVKDFASRGVATARTYPSTMDEQPPAAGRFVAESDLAHSRAFCRRVLNLPLYYGMPAEQQAHVLAVAAELFP